MTTALPTVFLIDESIAIGDLVAEFLGRSGRIEVVGVATDELDALGRIRVTRPDVVVVDRLPRVDLRAVGTSPGLVLHVATAPSRDTSELRRHGVTAIVFRQVNLLDELVAAVLDAAAGRENGDEGPSRPRRG